MESYGKLIDGKLQLSSNPCLLGAREALEVQEVPVGAKLVSFAEIPSFDQLTEYVYQLEPVDGKSGITVGVAVGEVVPDDDAARDMMMHGPVEPAPAPVEDSGIALKEV